MLAPCPSCGRHIRSTEASCPFCQTATTDAFREQKAPVPTARRLGRAALLTLAASAAGAVTVSACSNGDVYGGPPVDFDSGTDAASTDGGKIDPVEGGLQPAYGGPPVKLDASDQ